MTHSHHASAPSSVFLERIFRELDARLTQLQTMRDAIAALAATTAPAIPLPPEPEPLAVSAAAAEPSAAAPPAMEQAPAATDQPPRRRGRPVGSRNRRPYSPPPALPRPAEPRALNSAIPAGPVVVSPAQLARKREAAPPPAAEVRAEPQPAFGGLEALIREVQERRAFV